MLSCIEANCQENLLDLDFNPEWYEVMQFTGLHDKNGKEIYEGDICRVDHLDKRYKPSNEQISWDKTEGWSVGCGSTTEVHWSHEVIGDIYQNPELLEIKSK